jgi:ribonuclease J
MFSTNLFRIQALLEVAALTGRRLLLLGRSLQRNVQIGRDLGLLKVAADVWIDEDAAHSVPEDQLIIACTGSQAQPRAALGRMAFDSLAGYQLTAGDTVVFSARSIPGNESGIARLKDQIIRRGATVIDSGPVHCSGHACRDEQARMLELVRPKSFIPVHGDHRYLVAHAALAAELGITRDSHVLDNGHVLEIGPKKCRVVDTFNPQQICVSGTAFGTLRGDAVRARKRLASRGLGVIILVVDSASGDLEQAPEIENHGLFDAAYAGGLIEDILDATEDAFYDLSASARMNGDRAAEAVRVGVLRMFRKQTRRKPYIMPIIVYV